MVVQRGSSKEPTRKSVVNMVMNQSGKMKLLLRSLLLSSLCALSSWSASSELVVTQSPDVSVSEGQTVNISCCWTGRQSRIGIIWLKNNKSIKNETIKDQTSTSPEERAKICSFLTFSNIMSKDSGSYTCRVFVEIPKLTLAKGNSTTITVTAGENTTDDSATGKNHGSPSKPSLHVIISLAVVAPLFLMALVCFCSLQRKTGQAARVIYEVPHMDSVEADMDKHSTSSSRGSTQWCQVQLYDSLDYFERVETNHGTRKE
ncbi:uncharacterized protein LOC106523706 [Austrofundulus limnaeus]|uniref:Uncharacterized protein LOC106523706 n=1 Tax=Austrofundulus limnaeus TaxID=52670 RepID=A0A2I4BYA3_AUSLI|nr:PREDICTED: uncharacterized protein LOC106523706 [Austrofundulus limnaeus]